ncbi:MAG TPA: hypothetical protein PLW66_00160, partial [Saprospiraceae bacterium]|nr:hypothetical protein [Saprospiraceae bacterium]
EEAYAIIDQLAAIASQKDAYVLTGDAGNPEYTYFLRDPKGNFLANQPETFDTPGDRDKRKKATIQWFSNWKDPLLVNMEPDRFRYKWLSPDRKEILLEPAAVFLSKEEAQTDFMGKLSALWNQYLPEEGQPSDALRQTFAPHIYTAETEEFTREWTFELTIGDLLLKSANGFDNASLAQTALTNFKTQLAGGQLKPVDKTAWQLVSGKLSAFVEPLSPAPVTDSLQPVLDWIRGLDQIQILEARPTEPAGAAVYPFRPQITVKQIVKAGMPLAVRPKAYTEPSFTKGACPSWYNKFCWEDWYDKPPAGCNEIPDWLELCLDGRDVTVKADTPDENGCRSVFRYALRCARPVSMPGLGQPIPKDTVLWQSTSSYDSEAEAIAAFHDNFYKVLQAANNPANYQPAGQCIAWEPPPVAPDASTAAAAPCLPCPSGSPFVEVPYSTRQMLSQHTAGLADLLAALARTYPVFQVLVPDEQCGCACHQPGCCAGQKESMPDCNGQASAAPVQYKFHVYAPSSNADAASWSGQVLWESPRCFDNPADAWAAFRMLLRMIADGDACRVIDNQCSDCGKALGIMEVLLEKTQFDPVVVQTCDLATFYRQAAHARAFYLTPVFSCNSDNEADARFTIKVVGRDYLTARHPGVYLSPSDACAAMNEALELIQAANGNDPEWCTLADRNETSIKAGLRLEKVEKIDGYVLQVRYTPLQGASRILLESFDHVPAPQGATEADIDKAMSGLAYRFCKLLKNPGLNLRLSSPKDCTPFTFDLVDSASNSGILAENPGRYTTLTEAEQVMERIKECLFAESMYLVEHILLRPGMAGMDYCRPGVPADRCYPHIGSAFTWPMTNENWFWEKGSCHQPSHSNTSETGFTPPFALPGSTDCALEWQDKPVDPSCPASEDKSLYLPFTDPYSCWATVVLPGYTPRFSNPDFRRFVEDTLRKEAPAHVALCIRWLSPEGICCFEALYKRWTTWLRTGEKGCLLSADQCPTCANEGKGLNFQQLNEMDPGCALETFLQYTIFDLEATTPGATDSAAGPCNCSPANVSTNDVVRDNQREEAAYRPVCHLMFHRDPVVPGDCQAPEQPDNEEPPIQIIPDAPTPELIAVAPVNLTIAETGKTSKTAAAPASGRQSADKMAGAPDIKLILQRQNEHKTGVVAQKAAFENEGHAPDIFEQAEHYILHNAAIRHLPPLLRLLAPEGSAAGKNLPPALYGLLQLALFRALDQLALEHPVNLPEDARTDLREVRKALLSAGLSPATALEGWKPDFLAHHAQSGTVAEIQAMLVSNDPPNSKKKKAKK